MTVRTFAEGEGWRLVEGDAGEAARTLEPESIDCVVTSPPYWSQRDYGVTGQLGFEAHPDDYARALADAIAPLRDALHPAGTMWIVLGDTWYSGRGQPRARDRRQAARRFGLRPADRGGLGIPRKALTLAPWRAALALLDDGWVVRHALTWEKNRIAPDPVTDRPIRTTETVFIVARERHYHFDRAGLGGDEAVWRLATAPSTTRTAHYATYPEALPARCIATGCVAGGMVLDPFCGTGTTLAAALRAGRRAIGFDLVPKYLAEARRACDRVVRERRQRPLALDCESKTPDG